MSIDVNPERPQPPPACSQLLDRGQQVVPVSHGRLSRRLAGSHPANSWPRGHDSRAKSPSKTSTVPI